VLSCSDILLTASSLSTHLNILHCMSVEQEDAGFEWAQGSTTLPCPPKRSLQTIGIPEPIRQHFQVTITIITTPTLIIPSHYVTLPSTPTCVSMKLIKLHESITYLILCSIFSPWTSKRCGRWLLKTTDTKVREGVNERERGREQSNLIYIV
jgi:hypothetical protein